MRVSVGQKARTGRGVLVAVGGSDGPPSLVEEPPDKTALDSAATLLLT
jgi:hypothetical protein